MKESAYDWKLFDSWKPGVIGTQTLKATFAAAVTVDYIGIYGHNFGEESTSVKLQYSTAGSGGPWSTAYSNTPTGSGVIFSVLNSVTAQDWQVELSGCTVDTKVAVISFGEVTQLPDSLRWPFTPGLYQPYESDINLSQSGIPLGNTIKRAPIKFSLDQSFLTETEARDLIPVIQHLERKPGAFFSWDFTNYPNEALYIYPDKRQAMPRYTHHSLMRVTLKLNGIRD